MGNKHSSEFGDTVQENTALKELCDSRVIIFGQSNSNNSHA
jgi:hypothetical protein